jgi:hypothetical protein
MQRNNTSLTLGLPQKSSHRPRNERITNPVEPILPEPILPSNLLIDRVRADVLRDALVELAIKIRYVLRRRQALDARFYDLERRAVVQRCEVAEHFEVVVGVLGDDFGGVVVAAVDYAVAGIGDVFFLGDLGKVFVVDELFQEVIECLVLRFNLLFHFLVFCNCF